MVKLVMPAMVQGDGVVATAEVQVPSVPGIQPACALTASTKPVRVGDSVAVAWTTAHAEALTSNIAISSYGKSLSAHLNANGVITIDANDLNLGKVPLTFTVYNYQGEKASCSISIPVILETDGPGAA